MAFQQVGVEEVGYWMTFPMSSPSFVDTIVSPKVKGGDLSESTDDAPAKVRKPYTITKQRERWTEEEHDKFLEALKLYGRAWRHIEGEHVVAVCATQSFNRVWCDCCRQHWQDLNEYVPLSVEHIGTKTAVQIRSHAQKFFSKLEREASLGGSSATGGSGDIEIPPPRPKRKPSHPYPRKAGGAFSGSPSFEEDGKSPSAVCSALTPLESPTGTNAWKAPRKVLQEAFHKTGSAAASLRLFGQTVVVPGSEKPEADIDQDEFSHSIACLESTGSPRSQVSVGTEEMPGITPPISNAESGVWDIKPQGCKSTAGFQAWVKDSEAARAKVSSHMDKPYENNVAVSSSVAYDCQVFHQAMTGQNLSGSCFTPWQPTSFAIGGNHTAPFPASIPMFWQGLVPHNFCHSKNEDANAASAIAAATFAVASAWQAIQGAIPVANNDSNISMVYSPIAMLAAVGKPVPVLGTQSPRPQSPFKLNVNACEIKKREQGGNHKCNAGNGNEDDPTSVHGEDSTAECCSSLTDASRLSCYESNDEGSPAKKRPRSSREVYMHMDREASKPQSSDSKSNAKVGMPTSIGNGLEVIGSSNGFVAVHLVMTPDCMDEVIGPNDKDVTEKSSVEQLLQSEANYQQKVQTDEEDSADNGNNDAEQQRDMHNQSGLLCESMQACGAIQHDLPMETNEGANEEERPSKDNNQCYDSNKETVLSTTMSHLGENKATSSKECCASSCLITESKDANMLQTDVNGRCTETGEHLFMLKAGSTLSSRYSGVGFIPYKRSLRMESSSMKVDKA